MSISTKFEDVYVALKQRINTLGPGMRIPSVREAKEEFNVAPGTICRAMDLLYKEGLIVKRVGKGVYVADVDQKQNMTSKRQKKIAIALPDYSSSIFDRLVALTRENIGQVGELVRVIRYDWHDRILRSLPQDNFDGLILLLTSSCFEPAELMRIKDFKIPVVIVESMFKNFAMDCVTSDEEMVGAMAADHLLKLGHRRLAVLISEPKVVVIQTRIEGFIKRAHLAGVDDVKVIDCQTQSGESSMQKGHDVLKDRLEKEGLDFTGLYVVSDGSALGAIKACQTLKIDIPTRLSIIGSDGNPEGAFYHPSLTTVEIDRTQIIQTALGVLAQRIDGNEEVAIQKMIRPRLVIRESTCPCA
jgi:DNA-binding LacI/PurR family transcriptional regulator